MDVAKSKGNRVAQDALRDDSQRTLASSVPKLKSSTTLPDRLYTELEAAIINGVLRPGQRLHAVDLATHFGVSIIPVREALSSLDQAGWVEKVPRHGVHVRAHSETELRELFEFRADVEGLVARWAAERRDEHDLENLERAVANSTTATGDELLDASADFRDALRAAAHNGVLAATSATLEKRARFYFSTVAHKLGNEWVRVHERVLTHVRDREPNAAAELTSKHIMATGDAVQALLFQD
jgi:DNA-binding GntR family transcriptional regulator